MSRRAKGWLLPAAALAFPLVGLAAGPVQAAPPDVLPRGPLRVEGRWLKDGAGRVVIVHGLQVARKSPPYFPPRDSFGARDALLIRRLGFNAVRLAWFWSGLEPQRDSIDRVYLRGLRRAGRLLASQRILLLVESHQDVYGDRVRGSGFPAWATFTDGVPLGPDMGFPGNYLAPAASRAFDNLWASRSGLWQEYAEAWRVIARAFRSTRTVLGYDLFNEPWPGSLWPSCAQPAGCPAFDRAFLGPLLDTLAAAVREEDGRNVIFYEPSLLFDFGAATWLPRPPQQIAPVGLSFHAYCLGFNAPPGAGAGRPGAGEALCPAEDGLVFENAASASRAMGAAPLFSEFGDTDDLRAIEHYVELADRRMVGWLYWAYKDWGDVPGGPGAGSLFADDEDLSTLKQTKADVLSRPYPMAVAGVPRSYGFERRSRRFSLEYDAKPGVRAPTVVFVPVRRRYPGGYAVEVGGARVTSPRCASYLTLANRPRARRVRVSLRPAPAGSGRRCASG